ncbi:Putative hemolysin [hydrothermal vent metagenome]|uniref:Putative hemolysin n=1 Tax=hydrothermal vent metagenome TaxID=652676 RepID=A0A1W1CM13_9ZZZZ
MLDIKEAYYKNFPNAVKFMPKFVTNFSVRTLQKIFHEKTFNDIYTKNHYLHGLEFADSMLENLGITYTVKPHELKNIPSTGRIIVVANHITGASDAFSLVQLMGNYRENKKVKFMVNGMLMGMTQASEILVPVDNITGNITKETIKAMNSSLQNEEAIIIFPSGIVNRWSLADGVKDTQWKASFLKIAKRNNAPILPIRIEARNSKLFYFISFLLPKKITGFMLPHEFATTGERRPLEFNIGRVIPVKSFSDKDISISNYLSMFREHLYTVGTKEKGILKTEITITVASNKMILKEEINNSQTLGHTKDGKLIVLSDSSVSPFLMQELGRVREISFRAIGGGTGTAKDNDLYDNYYKHLILWDEEDLEIVGAYRIGEVKDIIEHRGMEGLYTYNQCNFSDEFQNYVHNSVELGRSFIQPKYWGSRALDNLWQGVGAYLANNPQIIYTYGIVTINADTPKKAVAALVYFYSYHFSCESNMMSAKTPYYMSHDEKEEFDTLFKYRTYKEGFVHLKSYLKDLGTTVPTLFKQYAELYEEGAVRFFDFTVNEGLHGVVEGFITADNSRMKEAKRKRYIKNFEILSEEKEIKA